MRMIEVAKLASPQQDIHYVGVDRFEDRSESDGPGLTLKAAHQLLRREGVRVQLVPGNPSDVLVRVANSLGKVDLLIVPAELDSRVVCQGLVLRAPDAARGLVGVRRANRSTTAKGCWKSSRGTRSTALASAGVRRRAA